MSPDRSGRTRQGKQLRYLEIFRFAWGAALLVRTRFVLSSIHRIEIDRKALVITRILGARHLVQAGLSGIRPSPEVIAMGTWVDTVHSLTAVGLAVVDRHRARAGLTDAAVAALWALLGTHDLATGTSFGQNGQRGRDHLVELVLPRLPGGQHVWVRAERVRRQHQPQLKEAV
ncbi:hypothetical protein BST27_22585 [Mycobacterium intermedium]|uniref:Uncharacterized protein n=1 Tax=Mycobacterium intermedium TaxID=28445 RepID=A0A1E3S7X1_MYCIE|nr:hypothetical protein [Mycobacterium intermedium]MCV6965415.1 hypothetical protein [Mycobacterium intermedium]ODQ98184.1 hypothetical protein BHQ20_23380 [Mycobacterium intermedium]OPE47785.1 hypothetical protein BV508_20760 [Mycobacterium intermedium]ORA97368.1 hypothetical protein BST27_22585 [Mycobacterium intermedium]